MRGNRLLAVAIAAVVAASVVACSGTGAPAALTKVRLQLQWFPQAQFAGYFAAVEKGFYAAEGLDVQILPGGVDIVPATVVAGGNAEFGISWVPKMLASRESGADVQIIGQVFQRSGTLQVAWKDSGITTPEDWRGRKVGTWGFGNEHELYAAMRKVGIDPGSASDVTIVPQDFTMTAFLNREIDAAQAMIYNEYAQVLEAKNPDTGALYQPGDMDVISMESTGTAMLQDAIFASEAWLAKSGNEDIAVKFLRASFKGWQHCRDNVDECVQIVLKSDAKLPKGHQTWQMNEINALIWPSPNGIGIMDQAAYDRTIDVALEGKVLTKEPTNGFRNDLAEKALANLGGDTKGTGYTKPTVTVTEGGN
ncbi:MAG TPA: ABC transporter substrate-binding protein [Candidatus Limnocylindrales bacterium]|jgi:NitT/TauT family transport system substrate-binding protein|nr:ABC transporter substrate-binding protein [Candidatus Limnocylindrales bacterium]